MEYTKRIFTDNSNPLDYELSILQDVHPSIRPMLSMRKTRLTIILILIFLNWISGIVITCTSTTPSNLKFLMISAIFIDGVVIMILIAARKLWCYPSNTIYLGTVALMVDFLKLVLLLMPYYYVFNTYDGLLPSFNLIFAWYLPYVLIFLLLRNKIYYLSDIKPELLTTWILTNVIYIPIITLMYGVIINSAPLYLFYKELNSAIIAVVYVLFALSIATIIAMHKKYVIVLNVLSVIWVILLLATVYEINDGLYIFLLTRYFSSLFNSMKLSFMCQDMISYIYEVVEIPIDVELSNSIRLQNFSYENL